MCPGMNMSNYSSIPTFFARIEMDSSQRSKLRHLILPKVMVSVSIPQPPTSTSTQTTSPQPPTPPLSLMMQPQQILQTKPPRYQPPPLPLTRDRNLRYTILSPTPIILYQTHTPRIGLNKSTNPLSFTDPKPLPPLNSSSMLRPYTESFLPNAHFE